MRILVTGATGYVGRRVAAKAVAAGHSVTGTARAADRVSALPEGVTPLMADLAEPETFVEAALRADAVLHTAFPSHDADWFAGVETERRFVAALANALAGRATRLVVSNGTAFYGDAGGRWLTEETVVPPDLPVAVRAAATRPATTTPGLAGVELRLASFVHGDGGSIFLPALIATARRTSRSIYVGEGLNRVSAVHVDAAADAYLVAAASGVGGIFHIAGDDAPTMRDLAAAVAIATGADVESVSLEQAAELIDPFTAMFLALDNGLSSRKARAELGWSAAGHPSLLWDVAHGSYASG